MSPIPEIKKIEVSFTSYKHKFDPATEQPKHVVSDRKTLSDFIENHAKIDDGHVGLLLTVELFWQEDGKEKSWPCTISRFGHQDWQSWDPERRTQEIFDRIEQQSLFFLLDKLGVDELGANYLTDYSTLQKQYFMNNPEVAKQVLDSVLQWQMTVDDKATKFSELPDDGKHGIAAKKLKGEWYYGVFNPEVIRQARQLAEGKSRNELLTLQELRAGFDEWSKTNTAMRTKETNQEFADLICQQVYKQSWMSKYVEHTHAEQLSKANRQITTGKIDDLDSFLEQYPSCLLYSAMLREDLVDQGVVKNEQEIYTKLQELTKPNSSLDKSSVSTLLVQCQICQKGTS